MLGSSLEKADTGWGFLSLELLTLHIFDRIKVKQAEIILSLGSIDTQTIFFCFEHYLRLIQELSFSLKSA